jgi:MFS family permease
MSSEDITAQDSNKQIEKDSLTGLEDEILQKKKKSPLKLIFTIISIAMFFGAFNLTIFFDTVLLGKFLCSPDVYACTFLEGDPALLSQSKTFSIIRTVSSIAFMISLVVGGAISDDIRSRFGNRVPMILFGSIIAGIGYILLPIFVRGNNEFYIIIISILIYIMIYTGLGFGLAPDYALISELFTKEERGWAGLGFAGVGLVGTVIGLILQITQINWILTGFLAGITIIILGSLTFIGTPKINPPFPADGTISDILATPRYLFEMGAGNNANKDFLLMFIVGILWGGGGYIIANNLPIFVDTLTAAVDLGVNIESANLLLIMGVAGALFAGPVGVVISKLGKVRSGMIGSIILGFFTFMLAQSFSWSDYPIYFLSILAGLGTIFITAVNVSLPADLVPRGKEGQFMGLFTVAANLLSPLVGILATFILGSSTNVRSGYSSIYLLSTLIYFGAVFILAFMHYEQQLEGEYQMYYRRYLIFKGYVSDKTKFAALKVSSSLRFKKGR